MQMHITYKQISKIVFDYWIVTHYYLHISLQDSTHGEFSC